MVPTIRDTGRRRVWLQRQQQGQGSLCVLGSELRPVRNLRAQKLLLATAHQASTSITHVCVQVAGGGPLPGAMTGQETLHGDKTSTRWERYPRERGRQD